MHKGTCLKRGCCWDDSTSSCYAKPGTCTILNVTRICLCGVRQLISSDMEVSIVAYEYGWNPYRCRNRLTGETPTEVGCVQTPICT